MSISAHLIQKAVPVLPAIDLARTNQYYRDRLHFQTFYYGDCLVVKHGQAEIHFYEPAKGEPFIHSACCLYVSNIEDVYAYFSGKDVMLPGQQLKETVRRNKEFSILDNNGNRIRFIENRG